MKKRHLRNKNDRKLLKKKEYIHNFYKFIIKNEKIKYPYKLKIYRKPTIFNFSYRLGNTCILTYRNRSIIKHAKLSRIFFKNYASSGYLVGFKAASW
jgi:ribosomal protein S14